MRSRAWRTTVAATVLATAALAGCGTDDADGDTPQDPTSPAASSADASETTSTESTEPTGSTESADPGAATGRRVETQLVAYRLPADIDWNVSMGGRFADWWSDEMVGPWTVSQFEHLDSTPPALDSIASTSLRNLRRDYPSAERLDNRVVNGVEGWVVESNGKNSFGRSIFHYEFGAVHGAGWATLNFEFPKDTPATREVIDSVLASIEWK